MEYADATLLLDLLSTLTGNFDYSVIILSTWRNKTLGVEERK